MRKKFLWFLCRFFYLMPFFFNVLQIHAREVKKKLRFAGMELILTDKARKIITYEVQQLTKNAVYFQNLVDKANLYFPLIEPILQAHAIPLDIKYLAIQESGLKPNAVSKSNAVGFWQFKDFTAKEVGLKLTQFIDQRMDILAATQGAARYFKKSQEQFGNWCYAVISYMTGRGGALDYIQDRYLEKKKMKITHKNHWYLLRLLAHKIVFEEALGKKSQHPTYSLQIYQNSTSQTLQEVAEQLKIDYKLLQSFNQWLKDESFVLPVNSVVILPIAHTTLAVREILCPKLVDDQSVITMIVCKHHESKVWIRGLPAIIARQYDSIELLAEIGKIALEDFLMFNEISIDHTIVPGQIYYFTNKRNSLPQGEIPKYTTKNLWAVAQAHGVTTTVLKRANL